MRSWEETALFLIGMVVASIIINAVRFKSLKSRLDKLTAEKARQELNERGDNGADEYPHDSLDPSGKTAPALVNGDKPFVLDPLADETVVIDEKMGKVVALDHSESLEFPCDPRVLAGKGDGADGCTDKLKKPVMLSVHADNSTTNAAPTRPTRN